MKELKVLPCHELIGDPVAPWNPVKELKVTVAAPPPNTPLPVESGEGIESAAGVLSHLCSAGSVESGEGIESPRLFLSRTLQPALCGIR